MTLVSTKNGAKYRISSLHFSDSFAESSSVFSSASLDDSGCGAAALPVFLAFPLDPLAFRGGRPRPRFFGAGSGDAGSGDAGSAVVPFFFLDAADDCFFAAGDAERERDRLRVSAFSTGFLSAALVFGFSTAFSTGFSAAFARPRRSRVDSMAFSTSDMIDEQTEIEKKK